MEPGVTRGPRAAGRLTPRHPVGVLLAFAAPLAAVRRVLVGGRGRPEPQPAGPPIEHIAADLRRLLWQHDAVVRSGDPPGPAKRLWALETAITRRATQAARALEVPHRSPPEHRGLDRAQLRMLLRALAAAGLALPATVGLMARDSRR